MKRTIRIPLVLIIILIVAIILCIKSFANTTGTITEITVNVREKASIDSDIIMFVTQDDKVEVLEKIGDWYKIRFNKKEGYVYADYVKVDDDVKSSTAAEEVSEKLQSEDDEVTKTIDAKIILIKDSVVKMTPNIFSEVIYTAKEDTSIEVLEQINGWSYISVNNLNGWVRNEQIKEQANENVTNTVEKNNNTQKKKIAYVKYDSVNLRKEPSADSSIIEKLKLNTEVTIIEEVDSVWNKVTVDGNTGYISKDLLDSKKQAEPKAEVKENTTTSRDGESLNREEQINQSNNNQKEENKDKNKNEGTVTSSAKGTEIVAYAKQFLGYDYVYGGSSPKTGFDCSGFTSYVYKHFGYNLARTTTGQANNGTKVGKSELQLGDIIIFKNYALTKIGHVGIYIGDNKFIHASEPGVGVIISDLSNTGSRYPQRFVMGRRIIK